MDLKYSADYESFRQQVEEFLQKNWVLYDYKEAGLDKKSAQKNFREKAIEAGYLYRSIPKVYGGSEQSPDVLKAQIIREEFSRVRAPMETPGVGVAMLVPTLLECGTEEQCKQFIPGTIAGDILWAQGYSEPNSGSDLASLKTKAELLNGKWVINGQKIWSTLAQYARYMFVLARTEPASEHKQAGISYLLVDMKQPGVTICPLKQITGDSEFCEVFFDDAVTSEEWIVGERGDGWRVSKSTLSHERSSLGGASTSVDLFNKLLKMAQTTTHNGKPLSQDPAVRQRLATLAGQVQSHLYSSYRQLSMTAHGQNPGVVTLMNKLINTNIGHDVALIAKDILGDKLLLDPALQTGKPGQEKWINQFFGSLGIAIAGGTSNIQRNVIAERGLGLPREDEKNT